MKLTNTQEAILISLMISYNNITKDFLVLEDAELISLVKSVDKAGKKIQKKSLLTNKDDIILADKLFKKLIELDRTEFQNEEGNHDGEPKRKFSSLVVTIIILNYLIMHHRNTRLRTLLGDINTMKYITILERDKGHRAILYHHMDVFEKYLKVIGIEHQPNEK